MSWLLEYTNHDEAYWVARVQRLIAENTTPLENGHGETNLEWIRILVDEIENNLPPEGWDKPYDGNMRMAAILSAVLGLWFAQLSFAKTQDSNRPTYVRQEAYKKRLNWIKDFIMNLVDTSGAATYFMGQPWQNPYDPNAKGGEFL